MADQVRWSEFPLCPFSGQLANDRAIQQHLRRLNQNRGLYFAPNAGGSEAKDIVGFNAPLFLKDDLTVEEQNLLFEILKVRAECLQETQARVSISIRCLRRATLPPKSED